MLEARVVSTTFGWACAVAAALWGCQCDSRVPEARGVAPASLSLARPPRARAPIPEDAAAPASQKPAPGAAASSLRALTTRSPSVDVSGVEGSMSEPFIVDGLVDVAAAGPATATEHGVVMVNRQNRLRLARLRRTSETETEPRETPIESLPESAGPFPLARGPAVNGGYGYWVSRGLLLAKRLEAASDAEPLVLARDARVGTRVAVPVGPRRFAGSLPALAAYIARPDAPDAPLTARLWIRGQPEPLSLTDNTTSAHSVALVETTEGVAAVFLEARTGMSAIHLRAVRLSRSGAPSLGEDRIVWIGGPGRPSTELFAKPAGTTSLTGLLALERDATHFGLVELSIPLSQAAPSLLEPEWYLYENGIEPAPFASAPICGGRRLILARPTSAVPHAPQELVLAALNPGDGALDGPTLILARSQAFFEVSVAPLGRGALLSYVADHRTWARSIRCVG